VVFVETVAMARRPSEAYFTYAAASRRRQRGGIGEKHRAPGRAAVFAAVMAFAGVCGGVRERQALAAGDGEAATALVDTIANDSGHASITAVAIAQARDALERATRLRSVGDEVHARAAEGLAREWAETARDLVRAADAEAAAADARRKAVDAQARVERARVMVEDGIARLGRLRAEADRDGGRDRADVRVTAHDRTAVERHDGAPAGTKDAPKQAPASDAVHGDKRGDRP
jgi:hypothetical protein